ncbi:MAG: T9SS type A sorting domain-containing protein, partial [Bacteroidia bacterium]|nr:T9SS type A sorting domain-containing protein [Bacteroidia bacterium]
CVCSYATDINIELKGINTFDVNLYGREIQVEVPISQIEKNFLNQSSIETDGANGSNLIYKYTDKMYADYQKQLADYNTKLKDYNSIGNLLKSQVLNITKDLVTTGTGLIFPSKALKELIVNSAVTLNGKEFPDTTTAAGWAKAAKEASKSIMGKGFDHYTQGFVTSKPTAPTMPTATLSEMRISGTITQSNLVQISGLHTPGSFKPGIQALQPHSYPIYNKPVGLFALLQKPEIEYYDESMLLAEEVIKTAMCVKKIYGSFGQLKYDTAFKAPKSKVYRLENKLYLRIKEPLKYKYNDASGVDKEKTKTFVSFIVEYDGDNTYINYYKNWARPTYVESQGQRIVEGNLELMHDNVLLNNNNYISRTYESEWVNIAEVNQKVFGLGFIDSIINTALGTPIEPNSCEFLSDREWEKQTKFKLKSIKMKLMTDMYFITNDDINTTQVFTYKIYDRNEPETQVAELTQVDDVSAIKKYNLGVIELTNEHISAGHSLVSQVNGSTLVVNVENLIVSGTLTTDPGFNLLINAQEKIEIKPEAEISPETELIAYANFFSTPVFTEVTNSELQNYCSGSNKKYNANTATLTKKEESKPSVKTIKPPKIAVYPNPANTILNLNLPSDYSGNIELFDMLGKVVVSINVNQINKAVIDVSFLQNGIYILKVTINEVMQSQKIVIQH